MEEEPGVVAPGLVPDEVLNPRAFPRFRVTGDFDHTVVHKREFRASTRGEFPGGDRRKGGGQEWIRTTEGVSQRIYSPPRLATSVPTHSLKKGGVLYGGRIPAASGLSGSLAGR